MTYTAILGDPNAYFANILLGGAYTSSTLINPNAFQISSNRVRIELGTRYLQDSVSISNFILNYISPPSPVPIITSIEYLPTGFDIVTNIAFTKNTEYSLSLDNIILESGDVITNISLNFTANVIAWPLCTGAFLSEKGCIDLVFDHPVGPYSSSAIFTIESTLDSVPVSATQVPWTTSLPENTLRINIPIGIHTGNVYKINYSNVIDDASNINPGDYVYFNLKLRTPQPYDYAALTQAQIINAHIVNTISCFDYAKYTILRVYFNMPMSGADNVANYSIYINAPHKADSSSLYALTSPPAIDMPTTLALLNEFITKFNAHASDTGVHYSFDENGLYTGPVATSLNYISVANQIQNIYLNHMSSNIHIYPDEFNVFSKFVIDGLIATETFLNYLKPFYNRHLTDTYNLSFANLVFMPSSLQVTRDYTQSANSFEVVSPYTYFVDLTIDGSFYHSPITVEATLTCEAGGSSTNPANYTGSITTQPTIGPANSLFSTSIAQSGFIIGFDKQVSAYQNSILVENNQENEFNEPLKIDHLVELDEGLPQINWFICNLMMGYNNHFLAPIHVVPDYTGPMPNAGLINISLSGILQSANTFKAQYNYHVKLTDAHVCYDGDIINCPDATDVSSLILLVQELNAKILKHITSKNFHLAASYYMNTAPFGTRFKISIPSYDYAPFLPHRIYGKINSIIKQEVGYGTLPDFLNEFQIDSSFSIPSSFSSLTEPSVIFIKSYPSVASVIPVTALGYVNQNPSLQNDFLRIWFSTPMKPEPLVGFEVSVTGGSIVQVNTNWESNRTMTVSVSSMEKIPYQVSAWSLKDLSGYQIPFSVP